tara:strand:- start:1890 stop:3728 length:1839 start_codon:yes stop_codon:yes gene_type:complete
MQNEVGKVQSKGRFGDTMLVHMNPIEVKAISDQVPGGLTTNPDTGLPEAFLPLALGLLGGWGGGALATGLGAAGAGLGSFAGSMLQGDDFKDAALGGLTSFGLGSMMNAAGGAAGGGMNAANEKLAGEVFKDSAVPTLSGSGQFGIPTNSFIGEGSGVPAFTEMGFKNQGKFLGNIGLEQAAKNALTVNPIGTAAAGIGLLGGGGGALMSPGEMPVVEPRAKKDYGDMSEKFPSPAREYRKPGIDYRPGIDPEFSYFSPQNIGYAVGGQVGYGYDKGTNTYNFNRTSTPTLTPSIPTPGPAPISIAGQEVGVAPQVIPATDGGDGVVVTPTEVAAIDNPNSSPIGTRTTGAGILGGLTTLAGLPGIGMALGAAAGAADAYQAEARGGRVTGVTPSISGAAYGASPFGIGFDSPQQQLDSFIGKNMDDFNNTPTRGTGVSLPSLPAGGVTPSALDDSGAVGYGSGQDYGGGNTYSSDFSDFAEGGQVQGPDPLIMGAVAAIMGSHPEPQQAIAAFVQVHGPEAFTQLRQQVIASASADQRGQEGLGGMIEGPGTGTSDSIPGQITQNGQPVEDIKVSNGEYILPEKAVEAFPEKKAGLDQFVANATGARPNNA